ncbi:hypothetical protein RCH20_002529 [Psychrobacter sp. PL15]|uniref:hypothetical protein n=1 Tax=Psychrobacter sp. PL15 TaxID=3071719 RepID=UPI002E04FFE3|nr:hypothetical protein [Psychrobacter sp. PL15]
MSMIGVSVASSKSLQLEAYDRAIVKLNLLLIEDKTYEQAIRARLFEVMDDRNELGDYSTSDLHIMGKGIEKNLADSLAGLNEQTVSA